MWWRGRIFLFCVGLWLGCAQAEVISDCTDIPDGVECEDGDPCTQGDVCTQGACKGQELDCTFLDNECQQGFCDLTSGECAVRSFEGSPCEDGDLCTSGETCTGGTCAGGVAKVCDSDNECEEGICDVDTGECLSKPKDDGELCSAPNACFSDGICQAFPDNSGSECSAVPLSCGLLGNLSNQCAQPTCDPGDLDGNPCAVVFVNEGNPCNDGNANTVGETCNQGVCTNGAPACTDDSREPNNAIAAATAASIGAFGLNNAANPKLTLCEGNQDVLSLRVPLAGEALSLEIHDALGSCSVDANLALLSGAGATLASDNDSGEGNCPAIAAAANLAAGDVFAAINSQGGNGDYILEIDPVDHDASNASSITTLSHEPNAARENADRADFSAGPYRGEISASTDVDFARFELRHRAKVFAALSDGAGGCPFDARLELLDTNGNALSPAVAASAGAANGCPLIDMLTNNQAELNPGSFILRVSGENGGTGAYEVNLILEAIEHEPNDNTAQAEGPTFRTGAVEGSITSGNADFYKFVLKDPNTTGAIGAPATLVAFTDGPLGGTCALDTVLELRDANGNVVTDANGALVGSAAEPVLDDDDGEGLCSSGQVNLLPGTYFLVVKGFGSAAGNYRLTFGLVHAQESEPNATPSTADSLSLLGGFGARDGRLTMFGTDVYSVVVPQGGDLKVETSDGAGGCATDTEIQIRGLSGLSTEVLVSNDDAGPGLCSLATATNLPAGTYFIAVRSSPLANATCSGSCDGPYTISVQVIP